MLHTHQEFPTAQHILFLNFRFCCKQKMGERLFALIMNKHFGYPLWSHSKLLPF
uniref:Uncharacterized protein n=1 Tax=Anguilla anguilla TaxID=7936 RepID=A0A0E9WN58_ANGAN